MTDQLIKLIGKDKLTFHCPACDESHTVTFDPHNTNTNAIELDLQEKSADRKLAFNQDLAKPTLFPDVTFRNGVNVCHFKMVAGELAYLHNSTHGFSGKIAKMLPIEP
jgi:hypothetical protein